MGWLGWSEEQALSASLQGIELAYTGRVEMLQAIYGGGKKADSEPELPETIDDNHVAANLKTAFRSMMQRKR